LRGYLLQRTMHSAICLAGLIVLVFFLSRLTGNPTDLYLPMETPADVREAFAERHGFNDPLVVQFGNYVVNLLRFDFGQSLRQQQPAIDIVLRSYPVTLALAAIAMSLSLTIAVVVGSLAAFRPGGIFDRVASFISLASASIPNFWVGIVGVLIFSVQLRWLPTSGMGSPLHWILPIIVLFTRPCGVLVQVVRNSMLTALRAPYVKTARAKGVKARAIIFVHALRNAMIPVITVAGDQAANMVNGAVITETIFSFPGIGKLLIDSIIYRDFAVVQAAVIVTAIAIFIVNLLVDILYALLDPRIRYSS
jgi:peptide/nickel transport system permease protein